MKLQKETIGSNVADRGHGKWYGDACGAAFAMELIGERWTLLIVRELMLGGRRFSDIRASLPGISAKVLTERLEGLEAAGVLVKRRLPPPAAAQVYELTEWGYGLEEVMQALGRWSVRSPLHDPTLPLTPVSFLLSLRTMFDAERAGDLALTAVFVAGDERLAVTLAEGVLQLERGVDDRVTGDLTFRAASVSQFLGVFYGKRPPDECGVVIDGEQGLARRFIDLFALPPKFGSRTRP